MTYCYIYRSMKFDPHLRNFYRDCRMLSLKGSIRASSPPPKAQGSLQMRGKDVYKAEVGMTPRKLLDTAG